ncbi:bifunctional adenosylcobinamide kinase/adenosylcobinamide-phosphate guanylyltransferase [Thermomonospora catenispora]|uniref:bifunctional adenosylcobinamide kinase/adenosylcobinamide-phosphate guanylyltransferase n=1 Tax=Thermomonospora catenispora TaxID=2493090 RepID=UPI001123DDB1|nr:bifunctional adenosylcobinamide kinase/adenosylcobinamide-phosphate guanylyltransferase [Thermomonospora catenispora]TNY36198.1 bifunctional adenosylcobinamide kinase/adenosylcobinamide-phosphate guanylyltransferase [Thermomonospora catenispora]
MEIELPGTAGPRGWPEPGCRCASCNGLRARGTAFEPTRALIDGVPLEDLPRREVPGGYDVRAPGGGRVLYASGPGARPEPAAGVVYDAVLLDLAGCPEHLGLLRHRGAVAATTRVFAVHNDHRLPSPEELRRRLRWWTRPEEGPHRTLLLGGVRSGKSAEAELRLLTHPRVTYVATAAPRRGDAEWTARIEEHRRRRPHWWRTVETTDLAGVLSSATGAVLVDGVGAWLAAAMDEAGAWDDPSRVDPLLEELVAAWRAARARVVAVSDEVGLAPVPLTAAGRAFGDRLGRLNQRLAAESEEAALVVAGRVLELR